MKLILASKRDPAGQTIIKQLLELYDFEKISQKPDVYACGDVRLTTTTGEAVQISRLPLTAAEVIFASRHASETGKPALTTHVPGDLQSRELAIAAPQTVKAALRELLAARDELGLPYEVSLEATHHGPTRLPVPVTFVEIGSSREQWRDPKAAEAVARAIMAAATSPIQGRSAIGIGGPHYAPRHTDVVLRTDVCIGHVLPKYAALDAELIRCTIARTHGGVELLSIDWKGLTSDQRRLLQDTAEKLGVPIVRSGELLAHEKV